MPSSSKARMPDPPAGATAERKQLNKKMHELEDFMKGMKYDVHQLSMKDDGLHPPMPKPGNQFTNIFCRKRFTAVQRHLMDYKDPWTLHAQNQRRNIRRKEKEGASREYPTDPFEEALELPNLSLIQLSSSSEPPKNEQLMSGRWALSWKFRPYQIVANNLYENVGSEEVNLNASSIPIDLEYKRLEVRSHSNIYFEERRSAIAKCDQKVLESAEWNRLKRYLGNRINNKNAAIDSIVCFGFGHAIVGDEGKIDEFVAEKHMLAFAVARELEGQGATLLKTFQGTNWIQAGSSYLQAGNQVMWEYKYPSTPSKPAPKMLDEVDAVLDITPNTMIFSLQPNYCVRQILADYITEEGGWWGPSYPPVILCDTVNENEDNYMLEDQDNINDPISHRVQALFAKYHPFPLTSKGNTEINGALQFSFVPNSTFGDLTLYVRKDCLNL